MRVNNHMRALTAVLGLLVGLAGCGDGEFRPIGTAGPDDDYDGPAVDFTPVSASPGSLEFTHLIGESPCRQLVGTVTIRNTGQARVTAVVSVSPPLALPGLGIPDISLEGNQSRKVEVYFDCGTRADFVRVLKVSVGTNVAAQIPVSGHVR
jgi:hypothetical protein